jgi:uncharacterized protein (TIGR02271 family)
MYERQPEYGKETPYGLRKVSDLHDWEVENDIRGWTLVDKDHNDFGKIGDMLADTETGEIPFFIAHYDQVLGLGGKMTLLPADKTDLDYENRRVLFHGTADDLKNAPVYTEDERDYGKFHDYWRGRKYEERPMKETEYREPTPTEGRERVIPETEERLEVGKREEKVGEAMIHKEAETHRETVREPVKKTHVRVYRRPVEPGAETRPGTEGLREGETIEIPVTEEKLVTQKKEEVTGEVVIQPETVMEEEEVTAELKKEHVEVEKHGEAELEDEEMIEEKPRRTGT